MDIDWTPIEPLGAAELRIDVSEFESVKQAWRDAKGRLEEENGAALAKFQEELRRSWAVETGILENLYMVDRGTTQTMIDKGFHQELVSRSATDLEPARLIEMLKDHLAASDMLVAAIADETPLTANFICQLQALITRHQESVEAVDSLGNLVRTNPERGRWKIHPNFRELEDGSRVSYCPPEQVAGQIDELLGYLQMHMDDNVSLAIVSAWLHHRFTQIHPFQDGNGRVARALVNYLFLKDELFPVVIDRDEKPRYIGALQAADAGDLEGLVALIADRQVEAIKQALSIAAGEDFERHAKVKDLAGGVLTRLSQRREHEQAQFKQVDSIVEAVAGHAVLQLEQQLEEFRAELALGGVALSVDLDQGGTFDDRAHYYRWEVVESARQARQWANFDQSSRWVRALVEDSATRLRFILSFHHVGRELTGIAEVTAIADLQTLVQDRETVNDRRTPVQCMVRPFSLTWRDDPQLLKQRFLAWLEDSFLVALRAWSDTL